MIYLVKNRYLGYNSEYDVQGHLMCSILFCLGINKNHNIGINSLIFMGFFVFIFYLTMEQ